MEVDYNNNNNNINIPYAIQEPFPIKHPYWSHPSVLPPSLTQLYEIAWGHIFGIALDVCKCDPKQYGLPYENEHDTHTTDSTTTTNNNDNISVTYKVPVIQPLQEIVQGMHNQYGAFKKSL